MQYVLQAIYHQGDWFPPIAAHTKKEAGLIAIARRIAYIEMALRAEKEEPKLAAADLILKAKAEGGKKRTEA